MITFDWCYDVGQYLIYDGIYKRQALDIRVGRIESGCLNLLHARTDVSIDHDVVASPEGLL